jgi:hypothetical protein
VIDTSSTVILKTSRNVSWMQTFMVQTVYNQHGPL